MILSLELSNFLSHTNTEITFSSGVNVISGPSNSGKTAILRSLYLVAENKVPPKIYVNKSVRTKSGKDIKAGESMEAIIRTDKGQAARVYGSLFNGYFIDNDKYDALDRKPPTALNTVINVGDVNFAKQKSRFLLKDTPGARGRFLNELTGIGDIDVAREYIASRKRDTTTKLTAANKRQTEIKEGLELVKDAPTAYAIAQEIITLQNNLKPRRSNADNAYSIKEHIYKNTMECLVLQPVIVAKGILIEVLERSAKRDAKKSRLLAAEATEKGIKDQAALVRTKHGVRELATKFSSIYSSYIRAHGVVDTSAKVVQEATALRDRLISGNAYIEKAHNTDKLRAKALLDTISNDTNKQKDVRVSCEDASKLLLLIYKAKELIRDKQVSIAEAKSKLPSVCPLCGGDYKQKVTQCVS